MKVSGLFLYPIKSLQGVAVGEAEVLEKGFKYDRRWMLVDSDNRQLTQRTHPVLSQINIQLHADGMLAKHQSQDDLAIPLSLESGGEVKVQVWNDLVDAILTEDGMNDWFSKASGTPCRLVFMPENAKRAVKPARARHGEQVSFADGYPYLIIGESSLTDLNERMGLTLPMNRFRPNIVVHGSEPYEEDHWKDFRIRSTSFYGTHACKRCLFTTIDQETGKKGAEPLKTLATYRKEGNEVVFGLNALASSGGTIRVGDQVSLDS